MSGMSCSKAGSATHWSHWRFSVGTVSYTHLLAGQSRIGRTGRDIFFPVQHPAYIICISVEWFLKPRRGHIISIYSLTVFLNVYLFGKVSLKANALITFCYLNINNFERVMKKKSKLAQRYKNTCFGSAGSVAVQEKICSSLLFSPQMFKSFTIICSSGFSQNSTVQIQNNSVNLFKQDLVAEEVINGSCLSQCACTW